MWRNLLFTDMIQKKAVEDSHSSGNNETEDYEEASSSRGSGLFGDFLDENQLAHHG